MSLRSVRRQNFSPLIENFYGQLFRAQMNKDWNEATRIQGLIGKVEERERSSLEQARESQMEQDQEGLRDYERAVR